MFTAKDFAGFQGKEVELWVKPSDATGPNVADGTLYKIRGAQNFNPTEEKAESRVPELGYDATKTIYGTTSYSVSTSLIIRDLVQIARMSGLNPNTAARLVVSEINQINCLSWVLDPDDRSSVIETCYVGGFKARTANKTFATEANATITLDGSADLVAMVDGKAQVREHLGDGSCTLFEMESGVAEGEVYLVENPAGNAMSLWDGYTYTASGIGGNPSITFTTAPTDGSKVRILYAYQ